MKVTKVHQIFALTQPFPYWMVRCCFPLQIVRISLTLHLILSSPLFLLLSLYIPLYLPLLLHALIYILKGHMRPLLCRVMFNNFQIFWSNYNLILTLTYVLMDNFLSLFLIISYALQVCYKSYRRAISLVFFKPIRKKS